MSEYTAIISWQRKGAIFADKLYSRKHTWNFDGGAEILASASPHVVPVPLSDPAGIDPEEAFVAAISSCHMLWFLSIACKHGFVVERYVDNAVGIMAKNGDGRLAVTQISIRPRVAFAGDNLPGEQAFVKMHHEAHDQCFIANSVRSEIRCEPVMLNE